MPLFTKDALYPGTYTLPDGQRVEYTRADVKHLTQRLKDMLAAGLQIPVPWNHQDTAKPMTPDEAAAALADRARHNAGFVTIGRETPEGILEAQVDIPADEDARRIPSVRFASPEIVHDFVDGSGRLWPGKSITHLAITARPVNANQKPFRPVRMSCVRLSLEGYTMADDTNKGKKTDDTSDAAGADAKKLKVVLEALRADSYGLPDDTDMTNLLDRLHTAALTKAAANGTTTPEPEPEPEPAAGAAASPVMMSMEKRLKAMEAKGIATGKAELKRRIEGLRSSCRISKPIADKLLADLGRVQLSLDESGDLKPNALLAKVEAYEELPINAAFGGARLSLDGQQPTEVPLPPEAKTAPKTSSEAKPVVDGFFAAMRG